jgi:hypothetical protein
LAAVVDFFEGGTADKGIVTTVDDFLKGGTADEGVVATVVGVIER